MQWGLDSGDGAVPIEQLERDLAKVVQYNITDKSFTVYTHDEKQFHQMKKLPHCTFVHHWIHLGEEKHASWDIEKNRGLLQV